MAALGALAAAVAVLWTPVGLIETVVASAGISEAVPAAAPPLGQTARLVLAAFAGLMVAGVTGLTWRAPEGSGRDMDEEGRVSSAQGAKTMGFAFSKLTALARGRAAPIDMAEAPSLRRADAHPDAPSRPPIFASRDFDGLEIFSRPQRTERPGALREVEPQEAIAPVAPFNEPAQPTFLRPPMMDVEEDFSDDSDEHAEPLWDEPAVSAQHPSHFEAPMQPLPLRAPTHGLSIGELTERLERGLALRTRATVPPVASGGVIADMPVPEAVPVRDSVARDTDDALRAALGALRTMAAKR